MKAFILLLTLASFHFAYAEIDLQSEKSQIAEMERALEEKRAALKEKEALATANANAQSAETRAERLRQRDYYLDVSTIISLILSDKFKSDSGTNRDRSRQSLGLDGGWNFGLFEAGPLITYDKFDADSYKEKTLTYGAQVAYNFISNRPGHDLVPYVSLRLYQYDYDHITNATHEKGLVYEIGGGVKYFPFGEYIALLARAYYRANDGEYTAGDFTTKGFRAKGSLLIYF